MKRTEEVMIETNDGIRYNMIVNLDDFFELTGEGIPGYEEFFLNLRNQGYIK